MSRNDSETVPRPPADPSPEQVFEVMDPGRCYVAADIVDVFDEEYDTGRWTIRRRLNTLSEQEKIVKRDHTNGTVTYQRPTEGEQSDE